MYRPRRKPDIADGDPLIPIMNLVCMLIPLLLYGAVFVKFQTLTVKPPPTTPKITTPEETKNLNLTVIATDQGFHLKVNPAHRKPWMNADGPDIPKKDGGWDFATLLEKLALIKNDHGKETRIILGAEDDVTLDVLIKMMDCSRGAPESPLFPDVSLTRGIV